MVYSDASQYALGSMLLQDQEIIGNYSNGEINKEWVPVGYWSNTLIFAEKTNLQRKESGSQGFGPSILYNLTFRGPNFPWELTMIRWIRFLTCQTHMPESPVGAQSSEILTLQSCTAQNWIINSRTRYQDSHLRIETVRGSRMRSWHLKCTPYYWRERKARIARTKKRKRPLRNNSTSMTYGTNWAIRTRLRFWRTLPCR